jgi:hypothetical protein
LYFFDNDLYYIIKQIKYKDMANSIPYYMVNEVMNVKKSETSGIVPGMGATYFIGSDSYAMVITEVLSPKAIMIAHAVPSHEDKFVTNENGLDILPEDLLKEYEATPIVYGSMESTEGSIIMHTTGTVSGIHKPIPMSDRALNSFVICALEAKETYKDFQKAPKKWSAFWPCACPGFIRWWICFILPWASAWKWCACPWAPPIPITLRQSRNAASAFFSPVCPFWTPGTRRCPISICPR